MVRPKSDAPKEHFLGVKLTDQLHEDLTRLAKELDRPKGWVVREALTAYVARLERSKRNLVNKQ